MGRPALILSLMLVLPTLAVVAAEDATFSETHDAGTFEIGYMNIEAKKADGSGEFWSTVLYYPAENESGQEVAVNASGAPFPVLFFYVDDGEATDIYTWIVGIVKAGYCVAILPDEWERGDSESLVSDLEVLISGIAEFNANGSDDEFPANLNGSIDVDHWGVAGHGTGAMNAALVYNQWSAHSSKASIVAPMSLFTLGIDISGADLADISSGQIADPKLALFITGTADQIAPSSEHLDRVIEVWQGGWHRMAPTGANHIRYQDEQGLLESLQDGSGNRSESQQQEYASAHIIPYLDLILKGDHTSWYNATNRENNPSQIQDLDAYLDENLNHSRMLSVLSTSSPSEEIQLNQSVNLSFNLSHRDGSELGNGSREAWCLHWDGTLISGTFANGSDTASCSVDSNSLAPGQQQIILYATWDGMMASNEFTLTRGNTPLVVIEPTPMLFFDQHSSLQVLPESFAFDPDGIDIFFVNATLNGNGSDNISIQNNGDNLTLTHTGEPEWQGTLAIDMWISETSPDPESINVSTVVTLLAVDDSVIQTSTIPQQRFDEDSAGLSLDISQWFEDPENGTLVASGYSNEANLSVEWIDGLLYLQSAENWSGAAIVNLTVSDGNTSAVSVEFPVAVQALPDPPVFVMEDIVMEEDESVQIPLSSIAFDSDGDELEYQVSIEDCQSSPILVQIQGSFLTLSGQANWYGLDSCWKLTVSDAQNSINKTLELNVTSVDDAPTVAWHDPEVREDGNISLGFTFFDEDQPSEHILYVAWRLDEWTRPASAACLEWSDGALACTVLLQPVLTSQGENPLWLKIESQGVSTSVQQLSFSLDDSTVDNTSTEADETVSMFDDVKLQIAAAAVVFIIIVAFLGNLRRGQQTIIEEVSIPVSDVVAEEVIEVVEEKPRGLLDLARNR